MTAGTFAKFQTQMLTSMKDLFRANKDQTVTTGMGDVPAAPAVVGFLWKNGSVHSLPEDFVFPRSKLKAALWRWFLPNYAGLVTLPPLRKVGRRDFAIKKSQTAFSSSWKPAFNNIEKKINLLNLGLINDELWESQPNRCATIAQVEAIWTKVVSWLPAETAKGKKRSRPEDFAISVARKFFKGAPKTVKNADVIGAPIGTEQQSINIFE